MKGTKMLLGCALLAASLVASNAQAQTTLRMTWYSDGNEGEVMADLLRRFEEQNKDIKVVLDQVPFKAINENLPVQLAAGQGPDLARVADLGGVARYMLDLRPLPEGPRLFRDQFRALPRMDAAAGRHDLDPGLHDAAHPHGPFRQQDPVRAGQHRDARCKGNLGRVGQGREGRRREGAGAVPDRDRPLGPPLLQPRDLAGREGVRRQGRARRRRRRLQDGARSSSTTGTRTA